MSGRCKACDNKLTENELKQRTKCDTNSRIAYSDLCYRCKVPEQLDTFLITTTKDFQQDSDE